MNLKYIIIIQILILSFVSYAQKAGAELLGAFKYEDFKTPESVVLLVIKIFISKETSNDVLIIHSSLE